MSDSEYDYDSDQEVSENHANLIETVRQLDKGQRVKNPEINEPSLQKDEFNIKYGVVDKDCRGDNFKITKVKIPTDSKPLEKRTAERIKREVGFENTRKELTKWTGIIARNRTAACVSFPLSQSSMKLEPTDAFLKRSRLQSELEKKLAEVDLPNEPEKEDEDKFPLTLEEILEKRKEAAKFRAQQSYKAAKALRQNKIKSKKYHRIQRKERIKKVLKEFEELQKTDPQAALEKLNELDRARAQERMTLRHKSTGQWAKSQQVRAKYDKESRQVLAEQLAISRDLTQKIKKDNDSEEDDDNEDQPIPLSSADKENPWINGVKSNKEINEFISGYRKFWDEKNKSKKGNVATEDDKNDTMKNKEVFEVPEIKEIPKRQNPVEEVIEEYLPGQNGYNEDHESDISEETRHQQNKKKPKKKLQRTSKDKLGIKSPKSKVTKTKSKVKAGTSSWSISPVDSAVESNSNDVEDIDIDEMFDSAEDKLQEKINRKLAKVKRMLEKESKYEKKRGRKNRRKDDSTNDVEKLGLKGQQNLRPIIDKPIEETANARPSDENTELGKITNITDFNRAVTNPKTTEIDPNKFMNMKPKHIDTVLPDEVGGEDEALDDSETEEDQHQIISEAFADDDVVDEFRKEKEEEIKKSLPEDVDMRLPGWGSWGGKDLKMPKQKSKRFILKFPKEAPRRDENKGDVVIIEEKCPKITKHLVNELPFPFTTVQDYEASMRAPIGRDFVPEKSFSKLITPAVKTKMGKIIEPMTDDVLVKTGKLKKRKKPEVKEEPKEKKQKKSGGKGNVARKGQQRAKKAPIK